MIEKSNAKRYVLINVATNVGQIVLATLFSMYLTPFYVNKLGLALYSMIPLCSLVTAYAMYVTNSISASVSRFVSISVNSGDVTKANKYFSTAVFGMSLVSVVLLVVFLITRRYFDVFFEVPDGYEKDVKNMFFLFGIGMIFMANIGLFRTGLYIKHRFDILNYIKMLQRIMIFCIIIGTFYFYRISVVNIGWANLLSALVGLILMALLCKVFTPEIQFHVKSIELDAAKDLFSFGIWSTISQLGSLLYYSIDLIVINKILGPVSGGFYSPVVQLSVLVGMLGESVSRVFTPIAFEYVSSDDLQGLANQTFRTIRYLGLLLSFPVGLLCGLSKPFLSWWISPEFGEYHLLAWVVIAPCMINFVVRPANSIIIGLNKIRPYAIVTILGGVCNLFLSIYFVKYTRFGIYGVGLATLLCLGLRGILFVPIYCSKITETKILDFYKSLVLPGAIFAVIGSLGLVLSRYYCSPIFKALAVSSMILFGVYVILLFLFSNRDDRRFLKSVILRRS